LPIYALDDAVPTLPPPGRYWVAPDATVAGRVTLGEDASVWFAAVLRGDNEPMVIGARTNIQDGAVCHSDEGFPLVVGDDCTIGHLAHLEGCVVEDRALVGTGSIVLHRRTRSNRNAALIAAQHRLGPDRRAGTDDNVADDRAIGVHECVGIDLRLDVAQGVDGHAR